MLSWTLLEHGLVATRVVHGGGGGGNRWSGGYKSGKRRCTCGATVKASGLPYSTSEYDLVDFIADYGVSSCEILTATKVCTYYNY